MHLRPLGAGTGAVVVALCAAAAAQAQVDPGFTCDASHFDAHDGCDCGCGVPDPDCGAATPVDIRLCQFDGCAAAGQVVSAADTSQCEDDVCGNGYAGPNEICDDGGDVDGGCSDDCNLVDPGFQCGRLAAGCQRDRCGDGVRTGLEHCDDGNNAGGDGCDASCVDEPGFICFDGQPCQRTTCGDGFVDFDFTSKSGETCEDGNFVDGDGCDHDCEAEPGFYCDVFSGGFCQPTTCGDGVVQGDPFSGLGETCDDQNSDPGDGCDDCVLQPGFTCFTGPCHQVVCGDGIADYDGVSSFEFCDDGNTNDDDGCSAACQPEPGFDCFTNAPACVPIVCGDGQVSFDFQSGFGEACDDGNAVSGDGCSADCTFVESGFVCTTPGEPCREPVCGDGHVDGDGFTAFEQCDDGNTAGGDGCSSSCDLESGFECDTPGQPCVALPDGWHCPLAFFGADDGCDCGCGAADPDCGPSVADCDFNHCFDDPDNAIDPCDPTGCTTADAAANPQCTPPAGEGEGEGDPPGSGIGTIHRDGCASTSAALPAVLAAFIRGRRRRRR